MGAELQIERLYIAAWVTFGPEYNQSVADRDRFRATIRNRLGQGVTSEIQRHVDVALGRLKAPDLPNPSVMKQRDFYQLLAQEMAVQEIERRIESGSVFFDPYNVHGLLPTLGLSWWEDVLPLLDCQKNPGYLRLGNVKKFLGMVQDADQQLPSLDETNGEMADHFREKRRELIGFLERAIKLREPVYCDL